MYKLKQEEKCLRHDVCDANEEIRRALLQYTEFVCANICLFFMYSNSIIKLPE